MAAFDVYSSERFPTRKNSGALVECDYRVRSVASMAERIACVVVFGRGEVAEYDVSH